MDAKRVAHQSSHTRLRAVLRVYAITCLGLLCCSRVTASETDGSAEIAAPNTSVSVDDASIAAEGSHAVEGSASAVLIHRSKPIDAESAPAGPGRDLRLEPQGSDTLPWYRSTMVSLLIVLGVIFAAVWCVRRLVPSFRASEAGVLTILSRTPVSQRQSIALVQVGRRVLVVGLSPGRVDRLAEIDEACEVAELAAGAGSKHAGPRFNNLLRRQAEDFVVEGDVEHEAGSSSMSSLLKKLKILQRSA